MYSFSDIERYMWYINNMVSCHADGDGYVRMSYRSLT